MQQTKTNKLAWKLFCFLLVVGMCQACAQNRITSSWTNPSFNGPVKGTILVIGAFKDPIAHKIFEDSFVASLEKNGISAVPSYKYGLGSTKPSKEELRKIVKKSGASSFLITHVLSDKKSTEVFLTKHQVEAAYMYWDASDSYHEDIEFERVVPGDRVTREVDKMQASLFDSESGKHIWSAWSESINFEDLVRKEDDQLERLFIKDMQLHKII
jgi:hypothetical protein